MKDDPGASPASPARGPGGASAPREEFAPAFLTGTSTEYLGRRPLPRAVRERPVVIVLGPPRCGKSSVAERFAGSDARVVSTREFQDALVERVRAGAWGGPLLSAASLVLDGPGWLWNRDGVVGLLSELLRARVAAGRRTVVCQRDTDGTVSELIAEMAPGSLAVIGLRFPVGQRGRIRFARRLCDELGLPRERAAGAELLEPWGYDEVLAALKSRSGPRGGGQGG